MSNNEQKTQEKIESDHGDEVEEQKAQGNQRRSKKKNEYDYHRKKRRGIDGHVNKKSGQKFTDEEDKRILQLVLKVGPKFHRIHRHFPGKTLAMVKNRYYKCLRYKWELLGQNYKHLNVQTGRYESLCEQQKNIRELLNSEKNDLVTQITSRTMLLRNARLFVEYFLVDYESDSQEEPPKPTQKTLTLDHLSKLSKKIKTNQETAVIVDEPEDEIIQPQLATSSKFHLRLPQPKNKIEQQPITYKKKRLPPMPPGINFKEAEVLSQAAIKKISKEELAMINEFDNDDMFMQDQKTINEKGIVNVTYEYDDNNAQIINLQGTNEKYWDMEREKMKQKQEALMTVPTDVNQLKREKNHIDSLHYQAALKQDSYETKRQDFKDNKEKMRARYGW